MTAASPDLARCPQTRPGRDDVVGTVLRLCSVFEPPAGALGRPDAAAYDPIGGMQNHTAELTRNLARLGVQQHVVTSRLGGPRARSTSDRTTVVRTGLPVRSARQLWAVEALRSLPPLSEVGLVHAHQGEDLAVLPLAELVARRAGVPLVVTLHCSVARTLDRSTARRSLRLLGPAVERRALRRADAVLVLTPSAAELLVADGLDPSRVHVLPSGFCPTLFGSDPPDPVPHVPHPRVLFLGRLAAQKRPLDAVAAHALLPDDVHLVVVGDGPLRGEVERAVAASPARDRVHVLGLVPHEQVPAYLRAADAFVLPSQYEELGSALVEAMAAGLPVVANRVGGIPDLVVDGETGLLAERGDVEGLAAALKRVLADDGLGADLAGRARAHVEAAYAWPALAEQVHHVYAAVQQR